MQWVGKQARGPEIRPTPILAPRSVAVVGATERPGAYGDILMRNLDLAGFTGEVYAVNPGRSEVHGRPSFPSVRDLPGPVDAVVVAVPAADVIPAIRDAIETGCGGGVVVSAGFGETPSGQALEAELASVAREAGFPVCGPNGNGVISLRQRAPLWGDAFPPGLTAGGVALISQSGNVAVNAIGSKRDIGFHTIVSTGNQAVLDTGDWLHAIAELEGVQAIALFQETDGDGAKLADALAICAEREIGVAVLKVGTSDAGQAAAAAHTGAIAGDQKVFRSLVEEAGAAWATDPHELLEITRVLSEPRARPRKYMPPDMHRVEELPNGTVREILEDSVLPRAGLAILTCSGGDSGIAADQAEVLGLEFADIWPAADRLRELLPTAATVANPLDYTSLLWYEPEKLTAIVAAVGEVEAVEQLIIFHDHPEGMTPEEDAEWSAVRRALTDGALRSGCPALLASTLPDLVFDDDRRELADQGIPTVGGMRAAIAAAAASQKATRKESQTTADRLRSIAEATRGSNGARTERDGNWLSEHQAKSMLRSAGISVPDSHVAASPAACAEAAVGLDYPLALKLSGPSIQHKSELGAVRLGIRDESELSAAAEDLLSVAGQIHLRADGLEPPVFLVEEMAVDGVELIVTARADAVVPSLTVGLGGIWAEYLKDSVVVPLPAPPDLIVKALLRLRAYDVLRGSRGIEGADPALVARFASKVGHLLLDYRDPEGRAFDLIELNPVRASSESVVALDAVAHLA